MAIALAFVIFIATFVTSQLTRDNEVKGRNVYVSRSERMFIGCGTIKEQLEGRFSEVQSICRMFDTEIFGGIEMSMRYTTATGHSATSNDDRADALVVDENFFQLLPYPLLEGTHESVLATTQSVVISESFARIFSPNESPMGKTIEIYVEGNIATLTVSGVFRDITNSVIRSPKIIYRIDQLQQLTDQVIQNGSGAVVTFFQLVPNADVAALSKEMERLLESKTISTNMVSSTISISFLLRIFSTLTSQLRCHSLIWSIVISFRSFSQQGYCSSSLQYSTISR